jgi:hypothetical protein
MPGGRVFRIISRILGGIAPPLSSFAAGFTDATSNWGLAGGAWAHKFVQIKSIAVHTKYRIVYPLTPRGEQDYAQYTNFLVLFLFPVKQFSVATRSEPELRFSKLNSRPVDAPSARLDVEMVRYAFLVGLFRRLRR